MSADVVFRAFSVAALPAAAISLTATPATDTDWLSEPPALRLHPSEERRARAMEPVAAARFRAGRLALRQFAADLADVPASTLVPDYFCPHCGPEGDRAHGRPRYGLDGSPLPMLLSLARTNGWVLLAGLPEPAPGQQLGVDAEDSAAVEFPGFDAIALTPAEAACVAAEPPELRDAARARLWVRKEAWLKMTGTGLRTAPAAVDVRMLPGLRDVSATETGLPGHLSAAVALGWQHPTERDGSGVGERG